MSIDDLRARVVREEDFERFDLILAMDASNYQDLLEMQEGRWDKVHMFLPDGGSVPDPYYGDVADFEHVLHLLQGAVEHWLNQYSRTH